MLSIVIRASSGFLISLLEIFFKFSLFFFAFGLCLTNFCSIDSAFFLLYKLKWDFEPFNFTFGNFFQIFLFFLLHSNSGRYPAPVSPLGNFPSRIFVCGLKRPKKNIFLFFEASPETARPKLPLLLWKIWN